MQKLNQKGITHHVVIIAVAAVVVLTAALAGLRVYSGQRAAKAAGCATQVRLAPTVTDYDCVPKMLTLLNWGLTGTASGPIPNPATISKYDATIKYGAAQKTLKQYVIDFQGNKGLIKDGIVGTAQTWPALCSLGIDNTAYVDAKKRAGCDLAIGDINQLNGWQFIGMITSKGGIYTINNYGYVRFFACRQLSNNYIKIRVNNDTNISIDAIASWTNNGTKTSFTRENIGSKTQIVSDARNFLNNTINIRAKSSNIYYAADQNANVSLNLATLKSCPIN